MKQNIKNEIKKIMKKYPKHYVYDTMKYMIAEKTIKELNRKEHWCEHKSLRENHDLDKCKECGAIRF